MHLSALSTLGFAGGSLFVLGVWPWLGVNAIFAAPFVGSLVAAAVGAVLAYRQDEEPSDLADRIAALHAEKYAAAANDMKQERQSRAS